MIRATAFLMCGVVYLTLGLRGVLGLVIGTIAMGVYVINGEGEE